METDDEAERVARAEKDRRKLYVLAIGVSDYAVARENGGKPGNLPLADEDAESIEKVFEELAKDLYDDIEITRLSKQEETTGIAIGKKLAHYVALMDELDLNDAVVFYYAGHAHRDDEKKQFYLIPSDGNSAGLTISLDPAPLAEGLLEQFCYRGKCPRLMILDTCYSVAAAVEELVERSSMKVWSADMFASSPASEPSFQDELGGRFTRRIVQGLEGGAFWWKVPRDPGFSSNNNVRETVLTGSLSEFLERVYRNGELDQEPVIKKQKKSWPLTNASFDRYMTGSSKSTGQDERRSIGRQLLLILVRPARDISELERRPAARLAGPRFGPA